MTLKTELEKWQKAAWALSHSGMSFRGFMDIYGPKIETITQTAIARKEKVTELRLCEQRHTVLKPNRLYRFTVDENCAKCKEIALSCEPV